MSFEAGTLLEALPRFERFCSVADLVALAQSLRGAPGWTVSEAGRSARGEPIHHLQFGEGDFKVLVVGFPHCNEPVGGLTAHALLSLLAAGHPAAPTDGIEWHVVPCIDPDGALLNEGWTQQPFRLESYIRNWHRQPAPDQVDASFPIRYKRLVVSEQPAEGAVLRSVLDRVRPDFFFSLHNSVAAGGAWFVMSRDLGEGCYGRLRALLADRDVPLQRSLPHQKWGARFSDGMYELFSYPKKLYDELEQTLAEPERYLRAGAASWDYLAEIKPEAVTFVAELPYLKYAETPGDAEGHGSLRRLKLQLEAENRFLLASLLDRWDAVATDVDPVSPFHRKVTHDILALRETLADGVRLSLGANTTRDILFNPAFGRTLTAEERLDTWIGDRVNVLCQAYEFVRLLEASPRTAAIRSAIDALKPVFDDAIGQVEEIVGAHSLLQIPHRILAELQLGSGLVALDAVLAARNASR